MRYPIKRLPTGSSLGPQRSFPAAVDSEFFTRAEARFALWDMQVRERDMSNAAATAAILLRDFPENPELTRFVEQHGRANAQLIPGR